MLLVLNLGGRIANPAGHEGDGAGIIQVRSRIAFPSFAGAGFGAADQAFAFQKPFGRSVLDSDIRALCLARTGYRIHRRPAVSRGQEGGQNLKEARIGIPALRVDDFEAFLADASDAVQQFDVAAQLLEDRKDARSLDGFVRKRAVQNRFRQVEVPANPVVHDGDGPESFRTDGHGRGPGDGRKLGFEAAPALGPISAGEEVQQPLEILADL